MSSTKESIMECDAREPTTDSLFWLEVGRDMVKTSTSIADEVAKQLITLNTALISAYVGAAKYFGLLGTSRLTFIVPIAVWLISIWLALFVLIPRSHNISTISPTQIKDAKTKSIRAKRLCLIMSAVVFTVGIIAVTWVLMRTPISTQEI